MSWRRTLDISVVNIGLFYQIYRAWNSQYMILYYIFTGTGILFFIPGVFLYKQKKYYISTICHCLLHLFANIGNIILYLGNIPSTKSTLEKISVLHRIFDNPPNLNCCL
jgi:hypothetical protein